MSISCDQGLNKNPKVLKTACYLLLFLYLGWNPLPVNIPFVKFIVIFPQQVGILNVHLQDGFGVEWKSDKSGLGKGN